MTKKKLKRNLVGLAKLKAALIKNGGILAYAAAELGQDRRRVHDRVKNSPELQAFIAELAETHLDRAESVILKAIAPPAGEKPDLATARWYLERMGKKRGYGNKVEASIPDEQLEQIVGAFGGDLDALRSIRAAIAGTQAA